MCVMSPSAGTGADGLHVELCVPNENHRAYSVPAARAGQNWLRFLKNVSAPLAPAPTHRLNSLFLNYYLTMI
jgi:hypothetical protein